MIYKTMMLIYLASQLSPALTNVTNITRGTRNQINNTLFMNANGIYHKIVFIFDDVLEGHIEPK